jgi:penicillin-binding protein 2
MFAATGKLTEMDSGGQLANTSIGQGKVEVSPLQMAMITATVANGGKSYYPRLISRVVDTDQNDVRDENGNLFFPVEPKLRADLTEMGLKPSDIEIVRRGMWKVVNDPGGTGKSAKIKGIEVAGKTGTAQAYRRVRERDANGEWKDVKDEKGEYKKEKDYHVWFTEFAPYKDPKYAICVMVESGGGDARGGTVAAPIATKIMRESLALIALDKTEQADAKFAPTVLQPVAGNFTPIKTVALADDGSMSKVVADAFKDVKPGTPAADDDERMDHDDDAPVIRRKRTEANVAAKKAADARGTLQPSAKPTRQPTWFERTFMGKKPAAPR